MKQGEKDKDKKSKEYREPTLEKYENLKEVTLLSFNPSG